MGRIIELCIFLIIVIVVLTVPLYHVLTAEDSIEYMQMGRRCFEGLEPSQIYTVFVPFVSEEYAFLVYKRTMPTSLKIVFLWAYWMGCFWRWCGALMELIYVILGMERNIRERETARLVAPLFTEGANALKAIIMWPF